MTSFESWPNATQKIIGSFKNHQKYAEISKFKALQKLNLKICLGSTNFNSNKLKENSILVPIQNSFIDFNAGLLYLFATSMRTVDNEIDSKNGDRLERW